MKCSEIIEILRENWPDQFALDWDNVGLLVGRRGKEVSRIFTCLDVTEETLEQAFDWGADLIISHHPLIFSAVKKISDADPLGAKILKLAAKDVACYAMHTNFDVLGMAELNGKSLELKDSRALEATGVRDEHEVGIGRVGELPRTMTVEELALWVKEKMNIPRVNVYGDPGKRISRAAISGGSGKSMVRHALAAGAQALVTGDIDYHTGIDAVAVGLCIIDAGHYGTEYIFISYMEKKLAQLFPDLEIQGAKTAFPCRMI